MSARGRGVLVLAVAAAVVSGCVASKEKHFGDVQRTVQERTGHQVRWYQGRPEDLFVSERIESLLDEPLTVRTAVQIALLNNPVLQSEYEQIGVSQADLVQAGLLKNPSSWSRTRWPDRPPTKPDAEFALTQDILDIFLLPLRRKIASMELEQAKLRLGQTVLGTIAEVRTAYYTVQAAEQARVLRQGMLDTTVAASERADRGEGFTGLNEVDLTSLQVTYRRAQIDLARAQAEVLVARAALQRLLGIPGLPGWSLPTELLPPPSPPAVTLAAFEATAMAKRLDLQATNFDLTTPAVQMARLGVFGSMFLAVDAEHGSSGLNLVGPVFQTDLPLWNWQQGRIASLKRQGRQGSYNVLAYRLQVQYEVRAAYAQLISARSAVDMYRTSMLPLQQRLMELSQQKQGAAPNLTDYLQVRQNETDVRREYVNFLRDYWIAEAKMERAIGTQIPVPGPSEAAATQMTPEAATTALTVPATQPAATQPGSR